VLDYLACSASSVPCEHLFLAGGKIAMKRRAQLGVVLFEELQMMMSAWRKDIEGLSAWNSSQIEDIEDEITQYRDIMMLVEDQALNEWDSKLADEFHFE
jgi:hypothetical protein